MTRNQYASWQALMRSRRGRWSIDPLHDGGNRNMIGYRPDELDSTSGHYFIIYGPTILMGEYENAFPDIRNAEFFPFWGLSVLDEQSHKWKDNPPANDEPATEAARYYLSDRLGVIIIRDSILNASEELVTDEDDDEDDDSEIDPATWH